MNIRPHQTNFAAYDFQSHPQKYTDHDLKKIAKRIVGEALIYLSEFHRVRFIVMDLELRFGILRSHSQMMIIHSNDMTVKVQELLKERQQFLLTER